MTVSITGTPDTRLTVVPDNVADIVADVPNQMSRILAIFAQFEEFGAAVGATASFWEILDGMEDNMPPNIPGN